MEKNERMILIHKECNIYNLKSIFYRLTFKKTRLAVTLQMMNSTSHYHIVITDEMNIKKMLNSFELIIAVCPNIARISVTLLFQNLQ